MMQVTEIKKLLESAGRGEIVVYGALNNAVYLYECFYGMGIEDKIAYFLVSSEKGNPDRIGQCKVNVFKERKQVEGKLIFIATSEFYFGEVYRYLHGYGCDKLIFWTRDLMLQIGKTQIIKSFEELSQKGYKMEESDYDSIHLDIVGKNRMQRYKTMALGDGMPYNEETREFIKNYDFDEEYCKFFGNYELVSQLPKADRSEVRPGEFKIYMVKSHMDHKIKENSSDNEGWLIPIQAGASLTDIRLCQERDSSGINISDRNRNLAEMTAVYWVWKNAPSSLYKGICHYRRRFALSAEDFAALKQADVDVVLGIPRFVLPNSSGNFTRHFLFLKSDLQLTMDIIAKKRPEYLKTAKAQMEHNMFYPCNMLIAKEKIFEEYCEFVFSIVLELDQSFTRLGIKRGDRFSAYLSELVSSIFWVHHKERLHIAVAEFQLLE